MSQVSEFIGHWPLDTPPQVIFEAGARDCKDTLDFHCLYPQAEIYTFECNPRTLDKCHKRVDGISQIHLIEKAVWSQSGFLMFHPIIEGGNAGASSVFMANGNYPAEVLTQDEIMVNAVTFADIIREHNLPGVDMLWLDLQGAELDALKGLGDYLSGVKLIMTEVMFQAIYSDQPLFREIDDYLSWAGFDVIAWPYRDHWFGNAIYGRVI